MQENKNINKKSLKFLNGKNTDWNELAKDCDCFANAQGGFSRNSIEDKASNEFSLKQKELISLGLLAQQQSYTALEISNILNQNEEVGLRNWLGRLIDFQLVIKSGKGKGTQYTVNPEFIRKSQFRGKTNLKNIEDHRLEELIYKDLTAYPNSGFSEIHQRIGMEINKHKVRRILKQMIDNGQMKSEGVKKWMRYSIEQNLQENQ